MRMTPHLCMVASFLRQLTPASGQNHANFQGMVTVEGKPGVAALKSDLQCEATSFCRHLVCSEGSAN